MDLRDLTPDEQAALLALLGRARSHLARVRDRMKARGWYAIDPLYLGVGAACDAITAAKLAGELQQRLPTVERYDASKAAPFGGSSQSQ